MTVVICSVDIAVQTAGAGAVESCRSESECSGTATFVQPATINDKITVKIMEK